MAANNVAAATDLASDVTKQIALIVGKINASHLNALADVVDHLGTSGGTRDERRHSRQFAALRIAAARAIATDDWTEFDTAINAAGG